MRQRILDAVSRCEQRKKEAVDIQICPYSFDAAEYMGSNQFIIMLKPELTMLGAGVNVGAILDRVLDLLQRHEILVKATRVLSSIYLLNNNIIEHHYGTLNSVSKYGLQALSGAARSRLFFQYTYMIGQEHHIMGGHEFLERISEFSSYALEVLTRNVQVVKIGAGIYSINIIIDDESYIVLNAFHPCQISWFTSPGNSVVVFECISMRSIKDIRSQVIGATAPLDAVPGSIKRMLLDEQGNFGLSHICTRFNGIHMSPGPLEGMIGVMRYFGGPQRSIAIRETAFGNVLLENGCPESLVARLFENPEVQGIDKQGPIFELTEDMNWDESLALINECHINE